MPPPPPQDSVPPKPKIKPSGIVTPQSRFFNPSLDPQIVQPDILLKLGLHCSLSRPLLLSVFSLHRYVYDRVNNVELERERCKDVCLKIQHLNYAYSDLYPAPAAVYV